MHACTYETVIPWVVLFRHFSAYYFVTTGLGPRKQQTRTLTLTLTHEQAVSRVLQPRAPGQSVLISPQCRGESGVQFQQFHSREWKLLHHRYDVFGDAEGSILCHAIGST